nr:Na+/H+ antiporter NhaC family protein [Lachnospiraceae bacterium]
MKEKGTSDNSKKVFLVIKLVFLAAVIALIVAGKFCTTTDTVGETAWALVPPLVAIVLALITKEVYSSLFIGIITGGLLYSGYAFEATIDHVYSDGLIYTLCDPDDGPYNVGILIFLVLLGIIVCLMNRAGGSAAFGEWASKHIKTRVGAQLATIFLGVLIFIDDYFNCLTVGSVMRPVTDKHKVSRAKLSYLIDSTAAPICIIAPVSSWAAAVSGFVPGDENGIALFIKTIPYNFYALLTIVMMVALAVSGTDFGPMALHEKNAKDNDDLFTTPERPYTDSANEKVSSKGKVIDLVIPVVALVICCIIGMIYTGGFFSGESFINAFANSDASVGLVYGSFFGLIITLILYL